MSLILNERERLQSRGYSQDEIVALNAGEAISSVQYGKRWMGYPEQPGIINSNLLQPNVDFDFGMPSNIPIVTPFSLTQPEQEAQDLITGIRGKQKELVGESALRAEKETEFGIPELTRTQTDLQARLKTLQNEALAIPLQLQQEAIGRGITTGGLQPIQTEALRKNAIQALSTASLLEASRGNLATAQTLADRAVAQKFDPIKEEINTKLANLELLLKSPELSNADKNRAQKQLTQQDARKRALDKQEENSKIAQAMAAVAVKNNPDDSNVLLAAQNVLQLNPSDPAFLVRAFNLIGQYQNDPAQAKKDLDAHLLNQAQIRKLEVDTAKILDEMGVGNKEVGGGSDYVFGTNGIIDAWINNVRKSPGAIKDVPQNLKAAVEAGLQQTTAKEQESADAQIQDKITLVESALDSSGLDSAVGPTIAQIGRLRLAPTRVAIVDRFGAKQDFIGNVQQLVSSQTLNALITAKRAGGTFGAVSDREFTTLGDSATKINNWVVKDGAGNVVGYNINQAAFEKELNRIKTSLTRILNDKGISADFSNQLLPGEILIERDGILGKIPEDEFDPVTDKRL